MSEDDPDDVTRRFMSIVLGCEVSTERWPEDTELGALDAVAGHWQRWGWPEELYRQLAFFVLGRRDAAE